MIPLAASRYLSALRGDAARIAELVPATAHLPVPACPGWDVADVVRHLGTVYRHKAESVRLGRRAPDVPPPPVPPDELVTWFDSALADVLAAIDFDPTAPAWSWWDADRTIGFWQRRMAQETLVHRVDVEQAARFRPVVDEDLAVDGVDEVLTAFLGRWLPVDGPAAGVPADLVGHLTVRTGGRSWDVRVEGLRANVTEGARDDAPARLGGPADAVLLWAWGREDTERLTMSGDPTQVAAVRRALAAATQ